MRNRIVGGVVALGLAISAAGVSLIKSSEGKRNAAYIDAVGVPTICYGHTGPDVRLGQRKSDAECEALLYKDIARHLVGVRACVRTKLTQNQEAAVTSLAFNIGVKRFCDSTMAAKLNARDFEGAAREFRRWKYGNVNGRRVVLRGLATRRAREEALFRT